MITFTVTVTAATIGIALTAGLVYIAKRLFLACFHKKDN